MGVVGVSEIATFSAGHVIDPDAIRAPTTLKIYLADMEDLEGRVGRFQRVVLHYKGAEHEFTPDEVLAALYEQRGRMEAAR
ncbi:MAG: hypothetical protein J6D54_10880 [Olsenella sp.]|nr:hypothetical protein [Olsenella sp.]